MLPAVHGIEEDGVVALGNALSIIQPSSLIDKEISKSDQDAISEVHLKNTVVSTLNIQNKSNSSGIFSR